MTFTVCIYTKRQDEVNFCTSTVAELEQGHVYKKQVYTPARLLLLSLLFYLNIFQVCCGENYKNSKEKLWNELEWHV